MSRKSIDGHRVRMAIAIATGLSLVFGFQNCGAPFGARELSSISESPGGLAGASGDIKVPGTTLPLVANCEAPEDAKSLSAADRERYIEDCGFDPGISAGGSPSTPFTIGGIPASSGAPSDTAADDCVCTPIVEIASLPPFPTISEPVVGPEWTYSLPSRHVVDVEAMKALHQSAVQPLCSAITTFSFPSLPDLASLIAGTCLVVNGDDGNNTLNGGPLHDVVFGGPGDDRVFGGEGKDVVLGGKGRDYLLGGLGADFVMGGIDEDLFISGGQGNDFVRGTLAGMGLAFKPGAAGTASPDNLRDSSSVVIPSVPGLSLNGASEQGRVAGGQGNDYVSGGPFADILPGNAGDDVIEGQEGPDRIFGDDIDDTTVAGMSYNDVIYGERANYSGLLEPSGGFVLANYFDDYINAGPGNDLVFAGFGDDVVEGGPGDDVLLGNEGNDRLYGGTGNDYLNGGPGNDELHGDEGDDVLRDNGGIDNKLFGGPGNDTYVYNPRVFDGSPKLNMVIEDSSGANDKLYCLESRARSYRGFLNGDFEMTMERLIGGTWVEVGTIYLKGHGLANGGIEEIHGCLNR